MPSGGGVHSIGVSMDNLFCDTLFLLVSRDLGEDGRRRCYSKVLQRRYSLIPR